jgi:hypothetical protein
LSKQAFFSDLSGKDNLTKIETASLFSKNKSKVSKRKQMNLKNVAPQ